MDDIISCSSIKKSKSRRLILITPYTYFKFTAKHMFDLIWFSHLNNFPREERESKCVSQLREGGCLLRRTPVLKSLMVTQADSEVLHEPKKWFVSFISITVLSGIQLDAFLILYLKEYMEGCEKPFLYVATKASFWMLLGQSWLTGQ